MKLTIVLAAAMTALASNAQADNEELLFAEPFDGKLADGWTWLREDKADWRIADGALEIRARPGDANSVRNALLRPLPEADGAGLAIEVTVVFAADLTQQFEQAGITWYADGAPVFKLVHERIDGDYYIIPGRVPAKAKTVRLRLEVKDKKYTAKFREEGAEAYQVAAEGDIAPGKENQISIQTYHGPADADHWMQFREFKILKTPTE